MKIALIFPNNIFTAPYLSYYIQILEEKSVSYDLIIWDRQGIIEENTIAYAPENRPKSNISKLLEFYRFKSFVKTKLKEGDYKKVIVFSCQMGVLLSNILTKNYNNQYILDIRDYSFVIAYLKRRFNKSIQNAYSVNISSKGFKTWLPNTSEYLISHNLNIKLIDEEIDISSFQKKFFSRKPIKVDTIGAIRDFESNLEVINSLKNNTDFYMNFIGKGYATSLLEQRANKMNVKNISFYGRYEKKQENELLKTTDFINILLDTNLLSNWLTSNRLYLSAMLKIPCLVNSDTEHSRIIKEYGFGIIINDYKEIPDKINDFVENFNKDRFIEGCNKFLEKVKQDYKLFEQNLNHFIN